ncbi:hypothetical protein Hdeb2414_s0020g00564921 [Helianthus debilis subsp. tardiflorus]
MGVYQISLVCRYGEVLPVHLGFVWGSDLNFGDFEMTSGDFETFPDDKPLKDPVTSYWMRKGFL